MDVNQQSWTTLLSCSRVPILCFIFHIHSNIYNIVYTSMLIFNMVSDPNFVLDIKQNISINERRFPHAQIGHNHLLYCLQIWTPQHHIAPTKPSTLPCRQIQDPTTHLRGACPISDLCKSSLPFRKPTTQTCSLASCEQNPKIQSPVASIHAPTRHQDFRWQSHVPLLNLTRSSLVHHMRRPVSLVILQSAKLWNPTFICPSTYHLGFCCQSTHRKYSTRCHVPKNFVDVIVTSSYDIIQSTSAATQAYHVIPKEHQCHVIIIQSALHHQLSRSMCLDPKPNQANPKADFIHWSLPDRWLWPDCWLVDWSLTLTFALIFDHKSKFIKMASHAQFFT